MGFIWYTSDCPSTFLVKAIDLGHVWKKMFSCTYLDKQTKLGCEIYPNLWYMRILHLAPKFEDLFLHNLKFLGKILIFENDRKTRNTNILFGKIFSHKIFILWYHEMRIVWFILHETLSQKLNSTKNITRLFKEKSLYSRPCHSKWGKIFWNYPYIIHMVS